MKSYVVLVDRNNRKIGTEEKMKVHENGMFHRAFSIFVFNSEKKLLLQQRAMSKYHSGGLWSNTACGHPKPEELYMKAAHRRLREEMGFDCPLKKLFCFTYNIRLLNGLVENEYDCVFVGNFDGRPKPNPEEVMDFKWMRLEDIRNDVLVRSSIYTQWFPVVLDEMESASIN